MSPPRSEPDSLADQVVKMLQQGRPADVASYVRDHPEELFAHHRPIEPRIALSDDLGTEYFVLPGAGGGTNEQARWEITATPPIPEAAKRLTVKVSLPGDLRGDSAQASSVEIEVDLRAS